MYLHQSSQPSNARGALRPPHGHSYVRTALLEQWAPGVFKQTHLLPGPVRGTNHNPRGGGVALPEAEWGAGSPALGVSEAPPGGRGHHTHLRERHHRGGGCEAPVAEGTAGVCGRGTVARHGTLDSLAALALSDSPAAFPWHTVPSASAEGSDTAVRHTHTHSHTHTHTRRVHHF